MRFRRLLSLWLVALCACGPKHQPADPTRPGGTAGTAVVDPAPPTAAQGDDATLPLWKDVRRGTLANGLTYYVLKHGRPDNRALLWLAVDAGSAQEDEDQRGLAHFVEHMAFNGTKRFPKAEIINYLESIGMSFGAHLNAYTSFDETVYQLQVPTENKAFLDKGFAILRDWAGDVAFDAAEIEKERGVVLEEWRLGRGAQRRLFDKAAKVLFAGTRYADRLPIGEPEILKTASRETLVRYYNDWYRPDQMAVIVVGDIEDPAAIEQQIQATFGDLQNPKQPRPRPRGGVPKGEGTRISIETDREMPAQVVQVYNVVPHRAEASANDLRRIVVESVYQTILNERLGTLARRQEAPFTAAFAGVQGITRDIDAFTRAAQAKAGRVDDTLRALFTEVLRVEQHGVTQSELDRARANLARSYEQAALEASTKDSREYAEEITRNFLEGELMVGREVERDLTLKFLPTITLAELNALAKSFGGAANRVVVIAGPEGQPLPSKADVERIIAEVAKAPIDPWQDAAAATALMAQPPEPGKIVAEKQLDKLGVTEWTLSNGARVVLKPTDFEKDSVVVTAESPGGLALASAKQFPNARFAAQLVELGGVGDLDADALQKVLAGKRVDVGVSIDETTEAIEAEGSARDLETMLQLMHLKLTRPRQDDAVIGVWKANVAEQLANQLRVPEVVYGMESQEAMFRAHFRRKVPKPAEIQAVDPAAALAFYKERFANAADFTFVIVGAVDPAKVRPLVETYLASLPAKGRKERAKDPGVRRAPGVVTKKWQLGQEPKAQVAMTFHARDAWTRDKDRDMYILGQAVAMRLREVLREDLGGVYGVGAGGSFLRAPRQDRTFTIQFGADPARVDELIAAVKAELAVIAKQGIAPSYLEKIEQQFLRKREVQLRSNEFWASWLATSYLHGDDPTIVLDPTQMTKRMTSANVRAAARRYLDGKQVFTAVLLPAAKPAGAPAAKPAGAPAAKPGDTGTAPR